MLFIGYTDIGDDAVYELVKGTTNNIYLKQIWLCKMVMNED